MIASHAKFGRDYLSLPRSKFNNICHVSSKSSHEQVLSTEGHIVSIVLLCQTIDYRYIATFIIACCLWYLHGWSYRFSHNVRSQEPYGSIWNTSTQLEVHLIMQVLQITTDDANVTTACHTTPATVYYIISHEVYMMTSSNGYIFRVTGPLCWD